MSDPAVIAAFLSDPTNAVRVSQFDWSAVDVVRPGLYSWWIDDEGAEMLERVLGEPIGPLIYAGQAGAASSRGARMSTATLKSRISGNHLNGTAHGSTFRKTLSALLLEPLGLELRAKDSLLPEHRKVVSEWMRDHLSLIVYPIDDRLALGRIESEVLRILDPPLNLNGVGPSPIRRRVSELRRHITHPAVVSESAPVTEKPVPKVRYMVPSGGPSGWQRLLAEPEKHWVIGRSARTLAHCWETADGWPTEVAVLFQGVPALAGFQPILGFPEFLTHLPGGSRASQTDLLILATDRGRTMTVGIEGKVDETLGPVVRDWLGMDPSPGKQLRLAYLCDLLGIDKAEAGALRYQLLHRSAAAKIEAKRNGSAVGVMLVHSWGPSHEGFDDYVRFADLLGVDAELGGIGYSQSADLWLGWAVGDPIFLES